MFGAKKGALRSKNVSALTSAIFTSLSYESNAAETLEMFCAEDLTDVGVVLSASSSLILLYLSNIPYVQDHMLGLSIRHHH